MARYKFGGTNADLVVSEAGPFLRLAVPQALTLWESAVGGTRYTDLLDENGIAVPEIKMTERGQVPMFWGPDGVDEVWVDDGDNQRSLMIAQGRQGPIGPVGPAGGPIPVGGQPGEFPTRDTEGGFTWRRERFDIRDFGGAGDDTTDNSPAAVLAIAAAVAAGGGEIWYPAGAWLHNTTVPVPSGVTVRGHSGGYTTIKHVANVAVFSLDAGADAVGFRRLGFLGTLPSDKIAVRQNEVSIKAYGTWDNPITNFRVQDCDFRKVQGTCVQMKHVHHFKVDDNDFEHYGYAAIGGHSVKHGKVRDNDLTGTRLLPSYVANAYGIYMSTLESDGQVGTAQNPRSFDVTVSRNKIRSQAWSCLDTHVGISIKFLDNEIYDSPASGINAVYIDAGGNAANALLSPQDIIIKGNTVSYNSVQDTSTLLNMAILLRGSISTNVGAREYATGVIEANVLRRVGRQDSSSHGAIFVGCGLGIRVVNNELAECRSIGVHVYDCIATLISGNVFIDLWRSSGSATAVFVNLQLLPACTVTVTGNQFARGRLAAGVELPAGAVVNNSAINGTNSPNITIIEGDNDWGEASFASQHVRSVNGHRNRRMIEGTAAPTTGTWRIGDQIINSAPASSAYVGWICVSGGTPGTWRGYGQIAAS